MKANDPFYGTNNVNRAHFICTVGKIISSNSSNYEKRKSIVYMLETQTKDEGIYRYFKNKQGSI